MARSATPAPENREVDVNETLVAQDMAAATQLGVLQASYSQGRDLVNQLLGQAQAFQAAGNLLQTFGVSKLAFVKENKLYQQLAGMVGPNGLELKGTWVEFCGLLGISDEKANQDITNVNFHAKLTRRGCGQKLGLPGGSSCTHTQTGFVQLSFTSSLAYVLEPRFVSWDTQPRTH